MKLYIEENQDTATGRALDIFRKRIETVKVLGLATGNTFVSLYSRISEDCSKKRISLKGITTFNLDEYFGIDEASEYSFRRFMEEHLFNNVDLDPADINFPDSSGDRAIAVKSYNKLLDENGPIDLQLLGIGVNGHIAFNEPGSSMDSRTRVVELSESTIKRNKPPSNRAITMGLTDILNSRTLLLMATGKDKAQAVSEMVNGEVGAWCPASYLRSHTEIYIVLDRDAASLIR